MAIETVLVPVDGSPQSDKAVEVALEMARQFESDTIHALFVVDSSIYDQPALSITELVTDEIQAAGEDHLAAIRSEAEEHGIRMETDVVHGSPKETIVDRAAEIGADLIVIGVRGEEYQRRRGSVCQYVTKHASCNVLVV